MLVRSGEWVVVNVTKISWFTLSTPHSALSTDRKKLAVGGKHEGQTYGDENAGAGGNQPGR